MVLVSLCPARGSADVAAAAGPAAVPASVASTFPLGIAGLTTNRDGSRTLWVLNTQEKRVVINGTSIFAIVDVILRAPQGYGLRLRGGSNCSLQSSDGQTSIECLPNVEPGQLVPAMTFTSRRPYPSGTTNTVELNSTAHVTVAPNVPIPATDRSPSTVRAYLDSHLKALRLGSKTVYVNAGKPTEYGYAFSTKTVPLGWITFVVTNRGRLDHSFKVCPSSGRLKTGALLDKCLQTTYAGVSYAPEVDDTLPLKPGETAFFSMRFTAPGKYEYLSDVTGQPEKGAKGQLVVK
jgi:hypothetical protein